MSAISPSTGRDPGIESLAQEEFLTKSEQRNLALKRLAQKADSRRRASRDRILAQEGESLFTTVGRVVYLSGCILFDGLVLTEIIVRLAGTVFAWSAFFVVLGCAIMIQRNLYAKWFALDLSLLD